MVSVKEILSTADRGGYAVGAFNFSNLEILQAIVRAAADTGCPAILAVSEGAIEYGGFETLRDMARAASSSVPVPLALHLDHGRNREVVSRCIAEGFTSVMFDGSHLPFADNVRMTREVVEEARKRGVTVEGELGRLVGIEDNVEVDDRDALLTDPVKAKEFVASTGVDSLAVAIGTSHGPYKFKGETKLDFERLRAIDSLVDVPLVMHGASGVGSEAVARAQRAGVAIEEAHGVSDDAIAEAIALGVRKINIDTDLRLAFTTALRESLRGRAQELDPRKILAPAREAVYQVARSKMEMFYRGAGAGK